MMKHILYLLFSLLFVSDQLQAQVSVSIHVKADTFMVESYKPNVQESGERLYVKMTFGSYKIRNPRVFSELSGKQVRKVQLVYSDYPKGADMSSLNQKRLLNLYLHAPQIFNNESIEWEFVKQTDSEKVYNLFHGFVLLYDEQTHVEFSRKNAQEYFRAIVEGRQEVGDSTVLKVFERHEDWEDLLVVCDFTGSMEPYIAEVMLWHHLSFDSDKKRAYIFFNDGDATSDDKKISGHAGGIYDYSGSNIDELINTAVETVEAGSGGDIPENDIEAILYGIKKYPEFKTVVLIADNWSNMRDFELYEQIDRPVKVILCGMNRVINLQYLNLAYKTGGSLHTIEQDITDLIKLKEGEVLKINGVIYTIKNGEFLPADES